MAVENPSSYSNEASEVVNAGGSMVGYSSSTGFYNPATSRNE
nr:hypothetical protein [Streptomyces sp. 846.5]